MARFFDFDRCVSCIQILAAITSVGYLSENAHGKNDSEAIWKIIGFGLTLLALINNQYRRNTLLILWAGLGAACWCVIWDGVNKWTWGHAIVGGTIGAGLLFLPSLPRSVIVSIGFLGVIAGAHPHETNYLVFGFLRHSISGWLAIFLSVAVGVIWAEYEKYHLLSSQSTNNIHL